MDRGAWWAAVPGVAKRRTRLSDFTFTFHFHALEKEMATQCFCGAWWAAVCGVAQSRTRLKRLSSSSSTSSRCICILTGSNIKLRLYFQTLHKWNLRFRYIKMTNPDARKALGIEGQCFKVQGVEKKMSNCLCRWGGEQIEINSHIYISKVAGLQRLNTANERQAFSV